MHCKNKSNLNIIRDYLDGVRPFTQISLYIEENRKHRCENDTWTDKDGIKWQKINGKNVKLTKTQADIIRECIGENRCKKCNMDLKWGKKQDLLFFYKTGMCMDCVIEYESLLRVKGIYSLYEKYKIISNEISFFKDAISKLKETIKFFSENKAEVELLCNSEGFLEKFHGTNKDQIINDAKNDLILVRKFVKDISNVRSETKKELIFKAKEHKIKLHI